MRRPLSYRPLISFFAFWGIGCLWFTATYLANPPRPHSTGPSAYGTTWAGELKSILLFTLCEVVVAALILQPWTYDRSWGRAGLTLLVLTPWLLLQGAIGLHSGPTTAAHTTWLVLLWVALLALMVLGFVRGMRLKGSTPSSTRQ